MRHSIPLVILGLWVFVSTNAQEAIPFQFQDPQALEINQDVLESLSQRAWFLYERRFYFSNETYSSYEQGHEASFRFFKAGSVQVGQKEKGRWKVLAKKLIYLDIPNERGYTGSYSVRLLSEKELILNKSLTSNHANRIELRFSVEQKPSEIIRVKPEETAIELDKPVTGQAAVPFGKPALLDQLKVEYFIRGLSLPEGIDKSTEGGLHDLYNQLIKKR